MALGTVIELAILYVACPVVGDARCRSWDDHV